MAQKISMNFSIFNFRHIRPVLILISLVLLLEACFRLYYFGMPAVYNFWNYSPRSNMFTNIVTQHADPDIGYVMPAYLSTHFKAKPFNTNNRGFRLVPDNSFQSSNTAQAAIKIAILGASNDMGAGVGDSEVYANVLQKNLNQLYGSQIAVDNYAVGGYKALQIEKSFWEFVHNDRPDIIVIPVYRELLNNVYQPRSLESIQPGFFNLRFKLIDFFCLNAVRKEYKDLLNFATQNKLLGNTTHWHSDTPLQSDGSKRNLLQERVIYTRLINELKTTGYQVIIVSLPMIHSSDFNYRLYQHSWDEWISTVSADLVIDRVLQLQHLMHSGNSVYPGDPHPNAYLHAITADILTEEIRPLLISRGINR